MIDWISVDEREIPPGHVEVLAVFKGQLSTGSPYISDVYMVWKMPNGGLARWPHVFYPTHWAEINYPSNMVKVGDVGILTDCLMYENMDYIGQTVKVIWVGSTVMAVRASDGSEFYVNHEDVNLT